MTIDGLLQPNGIFGGFLNLSQFSNVCFNAISPRFFFHVFEFSRNYTKLAMLSPLHGHIMQGKLIWAKPLLSPVGIEPATPPP